MIDHTATDDTAMDDTAMDDTAMDDTARNHTALDEITDGVLARYAGCPDARLKSVSEALVRHLHAFVREVEPSMDEWAAAISFLTDVGHTCTPKRQEFILLSDTLGVSMLVDAINHPAPDGATENTVLGPFYVDDAPEFASGVDLAEGVGGTALLVEGRVLDLDGLPIVDATVDTWQADGDGYYDVQYPGDELRLRGRFRSDADGRFSFWSIVPSSYPIPADGPVGALLAAQGRHPYRPAHVHFRISAPGHRQLTTHLFVAGDPYLDSDAVFGVKPSLVEEFTLSDVASAPSDHPVATPYARLVRDFVLVP